MADNENLRMLGANNFTDGVRVISNNQRASAGQHVQGPGTTLILTMDGLLGAENNATARTTFDQCTVVVASDNSAFRSGAINYGDSDGLANGMVDLINGSNVFVDASGSFDLFFSTISDSLIRFNSGSGTQIVRVQDGGSLVDSTLSFEGFGAIEVQGQVMVSNNTITGLDYGFVNYMTMELVDIEGVDVGVGHMFTGLAVTYEAALRLISLMGGDMDLTQSEIESSPAQVIIRDPVVNGVPTRALQVGKRLTFTVTPFNPTNIPVEVMSLWSGAGGPAREETLMFGEVATEARTLIQITAVTGGNEMQVFTFGMSSWQSLIGSSSPYNLEVRAYGYDRFDAQWRDYDDVQTTFDGVITLNEDPAIGERDGSVVSMYTVLTTPQQVLDRIRWEQYLNPSSPDWGVEISEDGQTLILPSNHDVAVLGDNFTGAPVLEFETIIGGLVPTSLRIKTGPNFMGNITAQGGSSTTIRLEGNASIDGGLLDSNRNAFIFLDHGGRVGVGSDGTGGTAVAAMKAHQFSATIGQSLTVLVNGGAGQAPRIVEHVVTELGAQTLAQDDAGRVASGVTVELNPRLVALEMSVSEVDTRQRSDSQVLTEIRARQGL